MFHLMNETRVEYEIKNLENLEIFSFEFCFGCINSQKDSDSLMMTEQFIIPLKGKLEDCEKFCMLKCSF